MTEEELFEEHDKLKRINTKLNVIYSEKSFYEEEKKILTKNYYKEYWNYYFNNNNCNHGDFTILKNIPDVPKEEECLLRDYSIMDVDIIGRSLAEYLSNIKSKEFIAKRHYCNVDKWYLSYAPKLIVAPKDKASSEIFNFKKHMKDKDTIIIDYYYYLNNKEIGNNLTPKTVKWIGKNGDEYYTTSYSYLIEKNGNLSFNYKQYKFIKEYIYSLAFYQKLVHCTAMDPYDTYQVSKKILSKIAK